MQYRNARAGQTFQFAHRNASENAPLHPRGAKLIVLSETQKSPFDPKGPKGPKGLGMPVRTRTKREIKGKSIFVRCTCARVVASIRLCMKNGRRSCASALCNFKSSGFRADVCNYCNSIRDWCIYCGLLWNFVVVRIAFEILHRSDVLCNVNVFSVIVYK